MSQNGLNIFPRFLLEREKEWLFFILPADRPGYDEYRKLISIMVIIGTRRFGEGNYVLGRVGDHPDLSYSSLPVLACGRIEFEECSVQITIHEFYDGKIEISIYNVNGEHIPVILHEKSRWTCSAWKPAVSSAPDAGEIRGVDLLDKKGELVLALSTADRTIWLYEDRTGMNHIIPVTNFMSELLRGNTQVKKNKGLDIEWIFDNLGMFEDQDLIYAFIEYNKYRRKVDTGLFAYRENSGKKGFLKRIFSK